MELPNIPTLKADAALALEKGREPWKAVLAFAGGMALTAAVLTVLSFWLGHQISNTGGLSNLGTSTVLSTVQMLLPLIQMVVLMSLELGYRHAMMRICRRQYADHTDLKVGFQKFFPLLRLVLLQSVVYFAVGFLTYQVASMVYMFTPWGERMMELILPLVESGAVNPVALMDDGLLMQAAPLVIPMFLIWGILLLAVVIPVSYRLRFAPYVLLDDSRGSALKAINTSAKMSRGNRMKLFRLDLSFWWYYLVMILVGLLGYLDTLLPMLGIQLPLNSTLVFFLCYGLYLAANCAAVYFLRSGVECTFIMAYESLCERPQGSGVVLGNIFDM